LALTGAGTAHADLLRHCATPPALDAAQQDRLFRFAALVRDELAAADAPAVLVARAGTDLQRFGLRHSHAGISLRASPNTPWSVRQLYYDCDSARPRLFDQGLPGFVLGGASPDEGHLVLWLLPDDAARALAATALDDRRALALLGATYSANAHAWSTLYQNCNQWVAELLAAAWGGAFAAGADPREAAQQWLRAGGYAPTRVTLRNPFLQLAAAFVPWLHTDDHPADALQRGQFDISLPASIGDFVHRRLPAARRISLCHDREKIVVRQGWGDDPPVDAGCRAGDGDRVIRLDVVPAPGNGA
jgi:hypothetical protein